MGLSRSAGWLAGPFVIYQGIGRRSDEGREKEEADNCHVTFLMEKIVRD